MNERKNEKREGRKEERKKKGRMEDGNKVIVSPTQHQQLARLFCDCQVSPVAELIGRPIAILQNSYVTA